MKDKYLSMINWQWINANRHGIGIEIWPDGSRYEG